MIPKNFVDFELLFNGILGMADIRQTYGEYTADIWRIYGGHIANIRRMVG